jgi:hypothetical protein
MSSSLASKEIHQLPPTTATAGPRTPPFLLLPPSPSPSRVRTGSWPDL